MNGLTIIINKSRNVCILFLVIGLVIYGPVMKGPFIFDDDLFIVQNKQVHSLSNIPQMLVSSTSDRALDTHSNFYRPLQQISFSILYACFGAKAMPFHLFSVLLHSLNAFWVFLLFLELLKSRIPSLLGALLFLIHPINTEAVCYISGLADVLGMFFMLSGLLLFIKTCFVADQFYKCALLTLLSFMLALLSKENLVILFPFFLLLYYFFYNSIVNHSRIRGLLGLFLILTVGYIVLKFTVFNFTGSAGLTNEQNEYTENIVTRFLTFFHVIPEYIRMIFYPYHLNYEKPYVAYSNLKSAESMIGLLVCILFLVSVIFAYRRKYKILFFALSWMGIAFIPYSGIIPLNAIYLEHWLYFPLVGFCLLFAALLAYIPVIARITAMMACVVVFILFGMRTAVRATEWASIEKFYTNELVYTQDAVRIYNNLAMYYADQKKLQKAIQYYQKALQIKDAFPQLHHNMANLYGDMGEVDKAIDEYYKALRLNPNFYFSLGQMVNICLDHNMKERAAAFRALYDRASTKADVKMEEIEWVFSANSIEEPPKKVE